MAWRSSGSTNEEMVLKMQEYGVVSNPEVIQAFKVVDRGIFAPPDIAIEEYYQDQPLKTGSIHMSAPHIYGYILESFDFQPKSGQSFLNIGSGTGYLSCIVAHILQEKSFHYGVELCPDVYEHCETRVQTWKELMFQSPKTNQQLYETLERMKFIHGNGLNISELEGEGAVGFDRIYVGAGIFDEDLESITKLLAPGGVLIAPVDDALLKIIRSSHDTSKFVSEELSCVRFAPLKTRPSMPTVVPAQAWSTSIHSSYPETFKAGSLNFLFTMKHYGWNNSNIVMLPKEVVTEVLSFTNKRWFKGDKTDDGDDLTPTNIDETSSSTVRKRRQRSASSDVDAELQRLLTSHWRERLRLTRFLRRHLEQLSIQGNDDDSVVDDDREEPHGVGNDNNNQASVSQFLGHSSLLVQSNDEVRGVNVSGSSPDDADVREDYQSRRTVSIDLDSI